MASHALLLSGTGTIIDSYGFGAASSLRLRPVGTGSPQIGEWKILAGGVSNRSTQLVSEREWVDGERRVLPEVTEKTVAKFHICVFAEFGPFRRSIDQSGNHGVEW